MPRARRHFHRCDDTSEILLQLDHYDDIFSDFDIRSYSNRSLSVDFVDEVKRASRDKVDAGITLILCVPKKRSESREGVIKERLFLHFRRNYKRLLNQRWRVVSLGLMMVALGVICMIAATLIVYKDPRHSLLLSFFVVFLEPAAWFLLWEGMDQVIFHSRSIDPELGFYRKMSHSHSRIVFKSC